MSRLHRLGSTAPGEPIPLEGDAVTVGRGLENAIVLAGPRVSRHHCTFHRMPGGGFKLVDAGSRNGTLVNGEMIAQKVLRPGDRIDIGGHEFSFGVGAAPRPVATRAAPIEDIDGEPAASRPPFPARPPRRGAGIAVTLASVAALVLVGVLIALLVLGGSPPDPARGPALADVATGNAAVPAATAGAEPAPRAAPLTRLEAVPPPVASPANEKLPAVATAKSGDGDAPRDEAPALEPERERPALTPDAARAAIARADGLAREFLFAEAKSALDDVEGAAPEGDERAAVENEIEFARASAEARLAAHDRLLAKLSDPAAIRATSRLPRVPAHGAVRGATREALLAGSAEVAWADVDPETYVALVRATDPGAESLLGLAYYAFSRGLDEIAHEALADALALEPGLGGEATRFAARLLGVAAPEGGFVVHENRFMTPESRDAIAAAERVRRLFEMVRGDDAGLARAAAAELAAAGSTHRDRLVALLHDRFRIAQEDVRKDPLTKRLGALAEEKRSIEERRRAALELIFDETRYPMPYKGPGVTNATTSLKEKTQREINKEVGALRKAVQEAEEKSVTLTADYRKRAAALGEACSLFEAARLGVPALPEDVAFAAFLPPGEKKVSARTLFASAGELADFEHNAKTLAENESVASAMTLVDREQLRITNQYRVLLGRRAVAHDERLFLAARAHSQEMNRCGYFGHSGATPETATLALRLRAQGFEGNLMGENIAQTESPQNAHDLWYESSGHHRNILNAGWTHLGTANAGRLFTQNFARIE